MFWKKKKGFPTIIAIVLIATFLWLLTSLGIIKYDIPWLPITAFIVALGWLINYYSK